MLLALSRKQRWAFGLCVVFLSCQVGISVSQVSRQFPHVDETAHLPSGISHWKFSSFDGYRVNPPLVRVVTSWVALGLEDNYEWKWHSFAPGSRPEFLWASISLHVRRVDLVGDFVAARLVGLVFTIGGFILLMAFAKCISCTFLVLLVGFWSFAPNFLANAPTIGPDVGSVTMGLLGSYACWKYLHAPGLEAAMQAGLALGLALLTKLTWLTGVVTLPMTVVVCWLLMSPRLPQRAWRLRIADLLLYWCIALSILNAGYLFEGSFKPAGQYEFCSEMLGGEGCNASVHGNRFKDHWLANAPVPVPRNYLMGIDYLKYEVEEKKWSFLNGEWKFGSWPHYYIMTTLLKTPEPTLVGALIGLGVLISGIRRRMVKPEVISMFLFLIVPAALCFASVSLQGGFNHHHRYVLMIYPPIYAMAAYIASPVGLVLLRFRFPFCGPKKRSIAVPLAFTLVSLSAVSSLRVHPHYTSYFNTLSGGPENGWRLLGFSNIDWGQDILEVDKWLKENAEKRPLVMDIDYFGMNGDLFDVPTSNPPQLPSDASILEVRKSITETQWWIISVKKLYNLPGHDGIQYLQQIEPVDRIAYAYHVYRIDPLPVDKPELSQGASP